MTPTRLTGDEKRRVLMALRQLLANADTLTLDLHATDRAGRSVDLTICEETKQQNLPRIIQYRIPESESA